MANNKPVGVAFSDPDLTTGFSINGTAVTSSAAEVNILTGVTADKFDLNTVADAIVSMSTTATPASGSNGVQFVFKDGTGTAIASQRSMISYISDVNGAPVTAVTSFAALTNGSVDLLIVGKQYRVLTTAAGLLGLTVTGSAGTVYVSFQLPNGKILTSSALVIN